MKILVTGGAGFIGSTVVRQILSDPEDSVVVVDCLTYAGRLESLKEPEKSDRFAFAKVDIGNAPALRDIFLEHKPDRVLHLAAESHVDRSIDCPTSFVQTNITGTYILLSIALEYYLDLPQSKQNDFLFHHVSTDEVFGSLGATGFFTEETPYAPRSPYSASKASSDHLVMAWHHTYGLPAIISNCSNNYGPRQFPEKLIPLIILRAIEGKTLPVYGDGSNMRDWIYVEDHARALLKIIKSGRPGETYLVGGDSDKRNIEVVHTICSILDELLSDSKFCPHKKMITFVKDRPGHDFRYAIDSLKVKNELNWFPRVSFETGLKHTVEWYLSNEDWWKPLAEKNDVLRRAGLNKE